MNEKEQIEIQVEEKAAEWLIESWTEIRGKLVENKAE